MNLRVDERRKTLLDRAAEAIGKTRSKFIIDAATREAIEVVMDRHFSHVSRHSVKRIAAALDKAPTDNPRLRKLLATKAPWE